jgi:hypothetical protein
VLTIRPSHQKRHADLDSTSSEENSLYFRKRDE